MPVVVNVRDVLSCESGERVTGVRGILKVAFDLKAFGKGEKAGTIQSGYLKDKETDAEIKLKVWNREDIRHLKGQEIILLAKQGPKGISGLKLSMDNYKPDNPELVLEVAESAEITVNDGPPKARAAVPAQRRAPAPATRTAPGEYADDPDGVPEPDDEIPGAEAPRRTAPAAAPKRASVPSPAKGSWKNLGVDMRRLGAFYSACLIEVVNRVAPAVAGRCSLAMNEETCHAAATWMAIQLMRDKGGICIVPEAPWKGYSSTSAVAAPKASTNAAQPPKADDGPAEPNDDDMAPDAEEDVPF